MIDLMRPFTGVGRTGCFAVVQRMLAELSGGYDADATRMLKWVRSRRMHSVDNVEQFVWLQDIADGMQTGTLKVRSTKESVYKEILDGFRAKTLNQLQ